MKKQQPERWDVYVALCGLGLGLFAGRKFQQGEFIFLFTGPVINSADAIAKGDAEGNVLQVGPTSYIDLEAPGIFTNHSCSPNAGVRDGVRVYAIRDIELGEEIRFDYSTNDQ